MNELILEVLKEIEWIGTINVELYCPCCGEGKVNGHKLDCKLEALIKRLEGEQ